MGVNPSHFRSALSGPMPVETVSWWDSVGFANEVSWLMGLKPVYKFSGDRMKWHKGHPGFRLPTEAEWEHAARAGQDFEYAIYDDVGAVAWVDENSGARPHPVGFKPPNAWGLRDMTGNVWEWCWDRHGAYPRSDSVDPSGVSQGSLRAFRGGTWLLGPSFARVAERGRNQPGYSDNSVGLRLVRTAP